ncbi:FAS1 domain containing protein [Quillaja saponaria]|uniref:FAS1 domain containing protein n=1 Tax=Quillaja saponaria TaxID=32244 RepID=A0AAD7PCL4_QUISA|nr:FAS1 domain containing protein [Quillaja saponaria]
MENQNPLLVMMKTLIIINLTITSACTPTSPTRTPPPSPSPQPPLPPSPRKRSPPPPSQQRPSTQQLNNIINALVGAAGFTNWANIISAVNQVTIPLSATLFIPEDNGLPTTNDPFMLPYHIVPQRLIFSELLLFNTTALLPTLLPGKSILVTSNSPSNFTLDDIPVTHPDLYTTATMAVHGIGAILDYSVYGDGFTLLPSPSTPQPDVLMPPPAILSPPFIPIGQVIGWRSDAAACLCTEFPTVFLILADGLVLFLF